MVATEREIWILAPLKAQKMHSPGFMCLKLVVMVQPFSAHTLQNLR